MDINYIGKLYYEKRYLGTVFFIAHDIAYSALHNFREISIEEHKKCHILLNEKKYMIRETRSVEELDFIQIMIDGNVEQCIRQPIITECIYRREVLSCKGYKGTMNEPMYVCLDLDEYTSEFDTNEAAEICMLIRGEEDGIRWNGISGSPVYNKNGIKGIVLRNIGNDGIKTRLKIISFNKIINFIVNNDRNDILEYFNEVDISSELKYRMEQSKEKCNQLYNICSIEHECENMNMITNYLNINEGINLEKIVDEIKRVLNTYALSLDERSQDENIRPTNSIDKIIERVASVSEHMKDDYNSLYILLWQMTEGIIECPRIGRTIIDYEGEFIECDVYLKKRDSGEISILIPITAAYDEIYTSVLKIIENIEIKDKEEYLDFNDIELDNTMINLLDVPTRVKLTNLISSQNEMNIKFEITALGLYNSGIYENIPSIINNEKRFRTYLNKKFNEEFSQEDNLYNQIVEKLNLNNHININLFVLPVKEIEGIKTI